LAQTSLNPQEGLRPGPRSRDLAPAKPVLWTIFALMTLSVFIFTDLPILKPTHPLHAVLYSQRWLQLPHIATALTGLLLGPLQFSTRLRQRNLARHRLLGKFYVGSVLVAGAMAPILTWHYPAFFPYSAMVNAILWWVTTGAAFLTARNRHIEQHRRWMARSYALASTSFSRAY